MSEATSIAGVMTAIIRLVKFARKRKKRKAESSTSSPQDGWGAMMLHEAGPMRSEPIVPNHQVDLGKRI